MGQTRSLRGRPDEATSFRELFNFLPLGVDEEDEGLGRVGRVFLDLWYCGSGDKGIIVEWIETES